MKVIVDNKIPYIKGLIEPLADEVIYLPGKDFTPEVVKEADALLIRTRTCCNRQLLEGSKIRFIGTATMASTTLIQNTVRKPASRGATVPDAMPEPWSNMYMPPCCCCNRKRAPTQGSLSGHCRCGTCGRTHPTDGGTHWHEGASERPPTSG